MLSLHSPRVVRDTDESNESSWREYLGLSILSKPSTRASTILARVLDRVIQNIMTLPETIYYDMKLDT